jgi:hypothetical protein
MGHHRASDPFEGNGSNTSFIDRKRGIGMDQQNCRNGTVS